ncbi:MAG TPA: tetratricopeptide repeat protein [Chitinophagaceae bacterium]
MGKKKQAQHNKKGPNQPARPEERKELSKKAVLLSILSLVITAICFLPMFQNGFTNWDDDVYVLNNPLLRGPDWNGIFTREVVGNYHPLTVITLAINYGLTELNPSSYLITNYLLHLINTLLVFQFIYKISGRKLNVAFFVAIIFGIHPMHVESVAWVSERKDVLYTLFFLLALIRYWEYLVKGRKRNYWLCLLFFLFSLLSKPAAIILPLVLILLDYWKDKSFVKKRIADKIPFFIFSLIIAIITLKIQSGSAVVKLDSYPLWSRPLLGSYSVVIYLVRFFVPYPLSAFHPFPDTDHLTWPYLFSPFVIVGLLIFLWFKRRNRLIIFCSLFFIVNLLLVSHIVSIGSSVVSERYTYVPYIAIAFLVGMWLDQQRTIVAQKAILIVSSLVIIVFGYMTWQQIGVWKDSPTLWTNVIEHYPNAPLPRTNRANYNIARAGDPAHINESKALYQQALDDCNAALLSKPDDEMGLSNRQNIYLNLGQDSLAFKDAETLIRLYPNNKAGYYTRGVVYHRNNQPDKALADLNKCLSLDATIDWGYSYRASILFNSFQKYAEAISDYNKAIELNPHPNHYLNRSYCYYYLGDIANAKRDAQTAVSMGATLSEDYRKAINL